MSSKSEMSEAITASAELYNLNDIIIPQAIFWWPLAEGWTVLFIVIISFLIPWLIQRHYRFQFDAYRRSALEELKEIDAITDIEQKQSKLFDLLKRTALSAYPRHQVAALTGVFWWQFLMKHSRTQFKTVSLENYSQILYNPRSYSDSFKSQEAHQQFVSQFAHEVKRWIMTHKRVKHVDS